VRKIIVGLLAVGFVSTGAWIGCSQAADEAAPAAAPAAPAAAPASPAAPSAGGEAAAPAGGGAAAAGGCCKAGDTTPPLDLVKATPKGGLVNPYRDQLTDPAKLPAIGDEGHKKYLSFSCNGCHGGGGGGGMCPPLTNDTWVYSPDDDTLFRLISLGSDGLKQAGYSRVHSEVVVGPMPPFGGIIKTSDDLWKVISFIRSVNPNSIKNEGATYQPKNY
jgi:mono/diheme cytochrome c family protein